MDEIRGYKLLEELSTQNAGTCQWAFCEREGRGYFIKRFKEITYPTDESKLSEKLIERRRRICEEFYSEKKAFYDALSCCRTGNNVIIQDFFRSGSKYYAITDRVYADGTDPKIISELTQERKETLIRSILYSISILHKAGVVHADIKPDNVLLKRTEEGFYTAKIIDFDAGFLVGKEPSELQGDQVYLAPETSLVMHGEAVELNEKIDIFALGILFHEYWVGERPQIGCDYSYVHEAVLDGSEVQLSDAIPPWLRINISRMLSKDPDARPDAEEILQSFRAKDPPATSSCMELPRGFSRPTELG